MKFQKRLISLFVILSGCAAKAPSIENCILVVKDVKEPYGSCTLQDGQSKKKTLLEMHKFVAFPGNDIFSYLRYCKNK